MSSESGLLNEYNTDCTTSSTENRIVVYYIRSFLSVKGWSQQAETLLLIRFVRTNMPWRPMVLLFRTFDWPYIVPMERGRRELSIALLYVRFGPIPDEQEAFFLWEPTDAGRWPIIMVDLLMSRDFCVLCGLYYYQCCHWSYVVVCLGEFLDCTCKCDQSFCDFRKNHSFEDEQNNNNNNNNNNSMLCLKCV